MYSYIQMKIEDFISKINYRAISANITMKSELLFHTIREIM